MTQVPVTLDSKHVCLRPLLRSDADALVDAARDGELWNSTLTVVPTRATIDDYIAAAHAGQERGTELPFVIIQKPSGRIVGSTRYYGIDPVHRRVEIGYTWLAVSAQRTSVNTESKLLLLAHAFEVWRMVRVAFVTDVMNQQSREAILRLGAKEEGILRNHMIMPDGRHRDSVYFSILCAEWPDIKAGLHARLAQRTSTMPNQPSQHNAGSRPVSDDSPASASPSLLGPRG